MERPLLFINYAYALGNVSAQKYTRLFLGNVEKIINDRQSTLFVLKVD